MTPQSELEITGSLRFHPFADLVAEIQQNRLNGSLRLSAGDRKCVAYFKAGKLVFAVSNARSSRLFSILLEHKRVKKEDILEFPKYINDFELVAYLETKKLISRPELDKAFITQVEGIVVDILSWEDGEWQFSSLARIRDGLEFDIDMNRLMSDYGRCLSLDKVLTRFRSLEENFERSKNTEHLLNLTTDEAFVLSRADEGILTAKDIASVSAMPKERAIHVIYTLWLAGLLERKEWQSAFSPDAVATMQHARLELKKEAKYAVSEKDNAPTRQATFEQTPASEHPASDRPELTINVDDYLNRVESAKTHYEVLGISSNAELAEIKQSYFTLAKMFHPDRYHAEGGDRFKRLQHAFTELSQAYETLKIEENREIYNYRMRKEIAENEKRKASGHGNASLQFEQAAQNFDRGFSLLMGNDHQGALPLFARAVHFAPDNARYHSFYGKALSADKDSHHQAENELQTAIRLDPDNANYRLTLAEFYIRLKMLKRAEGELNRLLAIFPSDREARDLLATIKA